MQNMPLPTLYSFRRCPYAMRARLALIVSGTRVELREIILRDKPAEMLQASPKGTVPVLILPDSTVIDESLDIMLWALEGNDPEQWLQDDLSEMLALIERCEDEFKNHLDRYKYANRYDDVDPLYHRKAACEFLDILEHRLEKGAFLFGDKAKLADMAIVTFVRQFANVDRSWFDSCEYPHVRQWLLDFTSSPIFDSIMHKYPLCNEGAEQVIFGK